MMAEILFSNGNNSKLAQFPTNDEDVFFAAASFHIFRLLFQKAPKKRLFQICVRFL